MKKRYRSNINGKIVSRADFEATNKLLTTAETIKPRTATSKLLTKLKKAIKGLMYMSESDYPFEVFKGKRAGRVSGNEMLKQIGKREAKIAVRSADIFFINQINNAETKEISAQWINLSKLLTDDLKDLALFAVGEIQVHLYFVGLSADGVLCGVSVISIET